MHAAAPVIPSADDASPKPAHDAATVLAVAMVAYLLAKVVHELLGHGGACLAVGGTPLAVSTSWFDGDESGLGPWAVRAVKAGGSLANLAAAGLLVAWLRRATPRSPVLRYFVWLSAAVQGFMGAGYLLTSPLFGFGDWRDFVKGLAHPLAWRVGLTTAGAALSALLLRLLLTDAEPFLGGGAEAGRRRHGRRLTVLPYLVVGGGVMTAAASLNRAGLQYAFTSALATLGGTAFLAWIPSWLHDRDTAGDPAVVVERHRGWIAAGLVALGIALGVLGPGLSLS